MDRERAKELLPVIQAFAGGKEIQAREDLINDWHDIDTPNWFNDSEYRIKPEPKQRRMTYHELAEWLAKGNGEVTWGSQIEYVTNINYICDDENNEVPEDYRIRKWGSDVWVLPLMEEENE